MLRILHVVAGGLRVVVLIVGESDGVVRQHALEKFLLAFMNRNEVAVALGEEHRSPQREVRRYQMVATRSGTTDRHRILTGRQVRRDKQSRTSQAFR
jgi:hypothetical protein